MGDILNGNGRSPTRKAEKLMEQQLCHMMILLEKLGLMDFSNNLKTLLWEDLGLENKVKGSSFPNSLSITNQYYPIPAVNFDEFSPDVRKMLTMIDIYVTDTKNFTANMRNIFKSQVVTFDTGKESRSWLNKPNFNYWPQQLNFAVWCASSGCGLSL